MENFEIKEKILSNLYQICVKRGRSQIWECFGIIKDANNEELKNFVACKVCKNVYKYHKNALSNLNKHKCLAIKRNEKDVIEPMENCKRSCTDVLTEWVFEDIRPLSLVNDNGLKVYSKLMLSLGSKYGSNLNVDSLIPHPSAIQQNIEDSYSIQFTKLKSEILLIQNIGYALTCDLWTENFSKFSYLALTVHFVLDGEYKSKLLGVRSMKGTSITSIDIKQELESLLGEFDCSFKDPMIVVTDRGSNIKAALNEYKNISCINDLLHTTIETCINSSPQINEIVIASSKMVKFLKKSGLNCNLNTSLNSFTTTRWNTVYFNLLSIKSNFEDVQKLLNKKNLTDEYNIIKECYLDQLIAIFKLFMEAYEKLEDTSLVTIHLVHPYIQNLKEMCSNTNNDEPTFITDFRTKLYNTLVSLVDSNITIYHKLAIFLFPPANQLTQFSLEEQKEVLTKCKSLLLFYTKDMVIVNPPPENNSSKIYSLFEKYVQPINETNSTQSIIENEIVTYKNLKVVFQSDFNVLKWWNDRKNEFPLLYKLSSRIFAIPASRAPSEKIFSIARPLITDNRSKIGSKLFNEILFVNVNSKD